MRFFGISMTDGMVQIPGPVDIPLLTVEESALPATVVLKDAAQTLTNKTIDTASNDITVSQSDVTGLTLSLLLKLDAANYTAADVLSKLLSVDGAGSGLDADTLDGLSSAAFSAAVHSHTSAEVSDFVEAAQDAVGGCLLDSSRIDFTYADGTPSITADLIAASVANSFLANMADGTMKGRALGAGTGAPVDLSAAQIAAIVAAALNIVPGTYTPTLTNGANITGSTAFPSQYIRVGSMVFVSGALLVDPTTTAVASELGISIPIASNFANNYEAGGNSSTLSVAGRSAGIIADPTNDRVRMVWLADDVTNHGRSYFFMYQVI